MYKCQFCGKEFENRFKFSGHMSRCSEHPKNKVSKICEFCGELFTDAHNYKQHINHCKNNPNKVEYKAYAKTSIQNTIEVCCKFCGKVFSSKIGVFNHERFCKNNPNAEESHLSNRGWSKGLTKLTDKRIKKQSESLETYYKTHTSATLGRKYSDETKQKFNKYYNAYRGIYDGILFMSGWELAYFIYMRDTGHTIVRNDRWFEYEIDGKHHRYNPDFIVDNSIIVEIKGYETSLDKIKYSVVPNLLILKKKQLKPMINYVLHKFHTNDIRTIYDRKINC